MDWLDKLPGFWKQAVPDGYARASHILFLRIDPDAESKADAVLARLTAGTISFPAAALEYSCCPTRDQTPAGDLGTFSSLSAMANVDEMRSFEGTLTLPCASAGDRTQHRYVHILPPKRLPPAVCEQMRGWTRPLLTTPCLPRPSACRKRSRANGAGICSW
jgi:hypothetical protein